MNEALGDRRKRRLNKDLASRVNQGISPTDIGSEDISKLSRRLVIAEYADGTAKISDFVMMYGANNDFPKTADIRRIAIREGRVLSLIFHEGKLYETVHYTFGDKSKSFLRSYPIEVPQNAEKICSSDEYEYVGLTNVKGELLLGKTNGNYFSIEKLEHTYSPPTSSHGNCRLIALAEHKGETIFAQDDGIHSRIRGENHEGDLFCSRVIKVTSLCSHDGDIYFGSSNGKIRKLSEAEPICSRDSSVLALCSTPIGLVDGGAYGLFRATYPKDCLIPGVNITAMCYIDDAEKVQNNE